MRDAFKNVYDKFMDVIHGKMKIGDFLEYLVLTLLEVGVDVAQTDAKAPFPYRTLVSIILLAGNILVAAIYFHVINP